MERIVRSSLVALALAAWAPALHAQTRNPVVAPRISNGQWQALQNRQQRQNFQQQQQFNRQLDNLSNQLRRPQNQVPVMKPTCTPSKVGISC